MNITYTKDKIDSSIAKQYIDEIKKNPELMNDIIISTINSHHEVILAYTKLQLIFQYGILDDIQEIAPLFKKCINEPMVKRMLFYPMFYHKDTCKVFNGIEKFKFLIEQGIDINTVLTPDLMDNLPQHPYIYHHNYMGKHLLLISEIKEIRSLIINHPEFNPNLKNSFSIEEFFKNIEHTHNSIIYHKEILEQGCYSQNIEFNSEQIKTIQNTCQYLANNYLHFSQSYQYGTNSTSSTYSKALELKNNDFIDEINQNLMAQIQLKKDFEQFLFLKNCLKNEKNITLDVLHENNYHNNIVEYLFNTSYQNEFLYNMVHLFIKQNNPYALEQIDLLKEEICYHKIEARHLFYEATTLNQTDWLKKMIEHQMVPTFTDRRHINNLIEYAIEQKAHSTTIQYLIDEKIDLANLILQQNDSDIVNKAFSRKLNKIGYQFYKMGFKVNEKYSDLLIYLEKMDLEKNIQTVELFGKEKNYKRAKI
jgi:hypothetical protein